MSERPANVGPMTEADTSKAASDALLVLQPNEIMMECAHCRTVKRASPDTKRSAFWKNKSRSSGYAETCKACNKIIRASSRSGKLPSEIAPPPEYGTPESIKASDDPYRDEKGHWLPGHAGIDARRGNARSRRWLDAINENVTYEDMAAIVNRAVTQARNGSRFARDWLWSYGLGKPLQMIEVSSTASPMMVIFKAWLDELGKGTDEDANP